MRPARAALLPSRAITPSYLLHGADGRALEIRRDDDDTVAESLQAAKRNEGSLPPLEHVDELRLWNLSRDLLDLGLGGRCLHEDHISSGLRINMGPGDSARHALEGQGIRAGDEHEIGIAGCVAGGPELSAISAVGMIPLSS